jgi:hypothetical protein
MRSFSLAPQATLPTSRFFPPFKDLFVTRLLALREAVGPVELIDARSGDPRLRAYESAGYDLNEGMLFEYNGTVYFGADAVNILATLSTPVSTFNRINGALLSKQLVARFFYPMFKFCRTITLKLRRVPKISGPNMAN